MGSIILMKLFNHLENMEKPDIEKLALPYHSCLILGFNNLQLLLFHPFLFRKKRLSLYD